MASYIECQTQDEIGILRISRPNARNALNWSAQQDFALAVEDFSQDDELRVLIITGEGDKAFAAGGDLRELANTAQRADGERLSSIMGTALRKLTETPFPVIAAINGNAFGGGCEILTACDLRIASPHVDFQFPQIRFSLTTGWGGTPRLVRLIGQSRAAEILLTGRSFSAQEALAIGFVHRLSDHDASVLEAALNWANELKSHSRESLAATKKLIWASGQLPLGKGYNLERELFTQLWLLPDRLEAMRAFPRKLDSQ